MEVVRGGIDGSTGKGGPQALLCAERVLAQEAQEDSPSRPWSRLSACGGNRGCFVLTPRSLLDTLPTYDPSFSAFAVLMPRGCDAETI